MILRELLTSTQTTLAKPSTGALSVDLMRLFSKDKASIRVAVLVGLLLTEVVLRLVTLAGRLSLLFMFLYASATRLH